MERSYDARGTTNLHNNTHSLILWTFYLWEPNSKLGGMKDFDETGG